MIKAKHTRFHNEFFKLYTQIRLKRNFDHFFHFNFKPTNKAILVISNHFSWWDGFFTLYLNHLIIKKTFYVMMLEEQLSKNMILQKVGAYSIKKGSRDMIYTMKYTVDLLNNPDNMVLLFPQGKIESMHKHHFSFERGTDYIIKNRKQDFDFAFIANIIDYASEAKPAWHCYMQQSSDLTINLEDSYNHFFRKTLEIHKKQSCFI